MNQTDRAVIQEKMGCKWIVLPDAINMDTYASIEDELHRTLAGENIQVVVDLSNTNNLFSSGLGLIIRVRKHVYELNGSVCLVNVSDKIRAVFEAVRLDKLFPLYATDVEFEISHEQFRKYFTGRKIGLIFIARVENGMYRLNFSGQLTVEQDLSPIQGFKRDAAFDRYVFDLTGLDMIDSTGAAALIKIVKDIHEHGGTSLAYGANPSVSELINLLGLDEYVALRADERSALMSIKKPLQARQ
jgi:anti-anti-sigma factor